MLARSKIRKEVKGVAGKRKCSVPKNGPVWRQSAEEATLARMPKYNAYACGTGAHGDAKYNRARQKQAWIRELDNEGPANRGAFPFDNDEWGRVRFVIRLERSSLCERPHCRMMDRTRPQFAFEGFANRVLGVFSTVLQLIY